MHTASCSGLLPDGDGGLLTREALHDGHGVTCFMDSCQEPQGMVPIIGAHGWLRAVAKARGTTTDLILSRWAAERFLARLSTAPTSMWSPASGASSRPGGSRHDRPIRQGRQGRRVAPRVKQDFDTIQRAEYADRAFSTIRGYFRSSCGELAQIGYDLRQVRGHGLNRFHLFGGQSSQAPGRRGSITVRNGKSRMHGFGDTSYVNQRHAENNVSNGGIQVDHDDYQLFLNMDRFGMSSGRGADRLTPEQAAERLWTDFVKQASIDYD